MTKVSVPLEYSSLKYSFSDISFDHSKDIRACSAEHNPRSRYSGFLLQGGFVIVNHGPTPEIFDKGKTFSVPVWNGSSYIAAEAKATYVFSSHDYAGLDETAFKNASSLSIAVAKLQDQRLFEFGLPLSNSKLKQGEKICLLTNLDGFGVAITAGRYLYCKDDFHEISAHVFHGHCVQAVLRSDGSAFAIGALTQFIRSSKERHMLYNRKKWGFGTALDLRKVINIAIERPNLK